VARSDLHNFGFFLFCHLFHFFDFLVGELLDLVEGALLLVFGDFFVFGGFLDEVVAVAADVADGGAVIFEDAVEVLDDFLAAILGHGRDGDADDLAVVVGIEAEVGGAERLFDFGDEACVPGRDDDEVGVGSGDLADLVEGGGGAVVVDFDLVEHVDGGAAGADGAEVGLEIGDGLVHAGAELGVVGFESGNAGDEGWCHGHGPYENEFKTGIVRAGRELALGVKNTVFLFG